MKKNTLFYIYLLLIVILFLVLKNNFPYGLSLLCLIMIIIHKFPKDKNYFKKNTIQIVIICALAYFFISYSLGIITGFTTNFFDRNFISILKNMFLPLLAIISQEIIRYIYAKNCITDKKPYIFLNIIYVLIISGTIAIGYDFSINENIFKYIFLVLVPTISHQMLYSYITYRVSLVPSILLRIFLELYIYVVPFFPDLGNYLISASGIIFPFITYKPIDDMISEYDKQKKYVARIRKNYFIFPIFLILICYISLIAGIGRFKLVAIASGSMEPCFFRGDAILYKKTKNENDLKVGTIIAYEKDGILITHRIVSLIKNNNETYIVTKGDNNKEKDPFLVTNDMVKGIVISRVPYVGYPTVWLNDKFSN